jgi:hypothetical protein
VEVEIRRVLQAGSFLSLIEESDAALLHSIFPDG